ncbi:hypothetical protein NG796_16410 [Laspinema sp. A4]|uniref:hypothetical protein n=1 Tax=Laspinema sp. D2d TaxID=2953686 RepID=UPI0021BA721A|nr:hypothetical protein [Laspinema sp. D2d]MCT7984854.1 hypothetical protein [Laspinema sp. D2d]
MAYFVFSLLFILFTIEVLNPKKSKKSSHSNQSQPGSNHNIQDRKPNSEGNHPKNTQKSSPGTPPPKSRG